MKTIRILYIGALQWAYNRLLLHGVASYARAHQWLLLVRDPTSAAQVAAMARRVDGLLIAPHPLLRASRLIRHCPAVSLSADQEHAPYPRVLNDDFATGQLAAEHLAVRGFRHLAFVGDLSGRWWVRRRHQGFAHNAVQLGLDCQCYGVDAHAHPGLGHEHSIQRWLRRLPRPLGIMACNDDLASQAIGVCRRLGLRVPADVAVVGVDNDDVYVEVTDPPLSTVALQNHRIGYEAGALLARLMAGETTPPLPLYVPPGQLIVRESSDTVATTDPLVATAIQCVREQLSAGVSVKEVLAEVNVSRSLLDDRFHRVLGRTVAQEIRRARIERARQLLSTSELAMPAVARHAGFSCARQLSETFHHETGVTPTAYRRRFRVHG